ncbi:binding-protein-dependent transport systems inner membrane component [Candidatus Vecturithrix granuli]|uniref:Binding-protein-dependent transport systems inner membrane component n=1 Tax=Vecturithrix granuli TaxID=1499967 RepID=A0A081C938_VECG1|nr:binding-protein-dependent transport systems inner membrane component [Candidatus Vecturithrix granuli]
MLKHAKSRRNMLENSGILAAILLAPAGIIVLGILVFPMLSALVLSFTDLVLTKPESGVFIGLANYWDALRTSSFWAAFGRTVYFAVITVVFEVSLGLAIALLLHQQFIGRGFVRGLIILPWALPYVVNGMMWKWIFDANYGAMNALLVQTHLIDSYRIWLGEPLTAMHLVIVANIWKETPVAVILFLAALQSIPKPLYEAARVDGANRWQSFLNITLPMLKPVFTATVVIKTIWALKEFDLIYIITKGGPADATKMLTYHIYQNTFKFLKFGYGSALAYLLTLTACLLAMLYMKNLRSGLDVEA